MYKVIHQFRDLQDGNHHYKVGETFPRNGKKATAKRIKELSGTNNKIKKPLIEAVEEAPKEETPEKPKKRTTRKTK